MRESVAMRRLEVQFRPAALGDLAEIYEYILDRTGSDALAEAYVERLNATCRRISEAAEAGRPRDDLAPGLRTWSFERRVTITYRVTGYVIDVTGIFYGGRVFERRGRLVRAI